MEKIIFDNGFTVLAEEQPHLHSAAMSFYVASGNRTEQRDKMGVAHFIEHMVFKGTPTMSAEKLAEESDLLGGQLNAYTTKEYTCFYSRALTNQVGHMLKIMCDMLCNPKLDKKDLETEKGVIIEEIGMYEDSPEDLNADLLNELCWKNDPLGFNILGTRETINNMTPQDLKEFMDVNYAPDRIVFTVSGKFELSEVLEVLHRFFDGKKSLEKRPPFAKQNITGGFSLCKKDVEQTQLSFGFNGISLESADYYPITFFSSITGGASSSRLNKRIREQLGLAYSAYTFSTSYIGTGVFGISGGLAHRNQQRFIEESIEIAEQAKNSITDEEVYRTCEQLKASLIINLESGGGSVAGMGRQLLLTGSYMTVDEMINRINSVTAADIMNAGKKALGSELAVCVVGSAHTEDYYKKIFLKYYNIK